MYSAYLLVALGSAKLDEVLTRNSWVGTCDID